MITGTGTNRRKALRDESQDVVAVLDDGPGAWRGATTDRLEMEGCWPTFKRFRPAWIVCPAASVTLLEFPTRALDQAVRGVNVLS
jgi:hypothetical protein